MRFDVRDREEGATYIVTLDDVNISMRCFAFDTEAGWADCYVVDDSGLLKIEATGTSHGWKDYDIVEERLFGDVRVTKKVDTADDDGKREHSSWIKAFFRAKAYCKRVGAIK